MPSTKDRATVIFDLDGTLIDSGTAITSSIQYALSNLGVHVENPRELLWCIGPPLTSSFRILLPLLDDTAIQRAISDYRAHFSSAGVQNCIAYSGVKEMLEALILADISLAIATAKIRTFAELSLSTTGLRNYFENVFTTTDHLSDKAAVLDHAIAMLGLNTQNCIFVGDREEDIRAAKACNVRCIAVSYGFGESLAFARADAIATNPLQIPPLVQQLLDCVDC